MIAVMVLNHFGRMLRHIAASCPRPSIKNMTLVVKSDHTSARKNSFVHSEWKGSIRETRTTLLSFLLTIETYKRDKGCVPSIPLARRKAAAATVTNLLQRYVECGCSYLGETDSRRQWLQLNPGTRQRRTWTERNVRKLFSRNTCRACAIYARCVSTGWM